MQRYEDIFAAALASGGVGIEVRCTSAPANNFRDELVMAIARTVSNGGNPAYSSLVVRISPRDPEHSLHIFVLDRVQSDATSKA